MPFCAIYTRVSSELQSVDLSISAQETELRERAEKDKYMIYGEKSTITGARYGRRMSIINEK